MPNTQQHINKICRYRGLPKLKKGDRCTVSGRWGCVWGGNSSANLNVKFDDGSILNCHPGYEMVIFQDGEVIHDSTRGIANE